MCSGGTPLYAANGDIPPGYGSIWLDNVDCNGNELNLDACYHNSIGNHNCDHYEDFGVQCSKFINIAILSSFVKANLQKSVNYCCKNS